MENCIAEVGSSYLCSLCGIEHADSKYDQYYLEGWTGILLQDTSFILSVSTQAQRAVDYILNSSPQKSEERETEEGAIVQEGA
jgi:antirestriction protein ArdC